MFRMIHGTEGVIDSVALAIRKSFARKSSNRWGTGFEKYRRLLIIRRSSCRLLDAKTKLRLKYKTSVREIKVQGAERRKRKLLFTQSESTYLNIILYS